MGRRGGSRMQLRNDYNEKRGYCKLKDEALRGRVPKFPALPTS